MTRLTFATVVYEAELEMLAVQARSFAAHVPPALIHRIYVLDNTRRGMGRSHQKALRSLYGVLAQEVRFVRAEELIGRPDVGGWWAQQLLKLAVSTLLGDEHYVLLDAKNHFVRTPEATFFVWHDARTCVCMRDFRDAESRPHLERILDYCGVSNDLVAWFVLPWTPFVMDAARVRAMMREIEQQSGHAFIDEVIRHELWEFWLYAAWTAKTQPLDAAFYGHQRLCPTVYSALDPSLTATAIEQAESESAPIFAVHRRSFESLDSTGVKTLCTYWVERHLFTTLDEAHAAVTRIRADIARHHRARRRQAVLRRAGRGVGKALRLSGATSPAKAP